MTTVRSYLHIPSLAFAAIMGMLSVVGEASACSAKGPGKAMGACCAGPDQSACCCDQVEPRPALTDRTAVGMPGGTGRLLAPDSPCECRPGEPTESAPKPESSSSENRTDRESTRSLEQVFPVQPTIAVDRLVQPTQSPPGTPLYLRTSRLLI
jgi:hypothetical protein